MKLKDCKHGTLVINRDNNNQRGYDKIGMIVGITNRHPSTAIEERSLPENAIPLVQFSCGDIYPIHQGNIEIYKGDL